MSWKLKSNTRPVSSWRLYPGLRWVIGVQDSRVSTRSNLYATLANISLYKYHIQSQTKLDILSKYVFCLPSLDKSFSIIFNDWETLFTSENKFPVQINFGKWIIIFLNIIFDHQLQSRLVGKRKSAKVVLNPTFVSLNWQ